MTQQDEAQDPVAETQDDLPVVVKRTPSVQSREFWVGWTTVAANILLPVSILIAGWGLWEQNRQAKLDAASDTVNLFFDGGLVAAQATLFSLWTQKDLTVLKSPQSRSFVDAFVERTIRASDLDQAQITNAIVSITSYFDLAEACVASGRCDEQAVMNQIGRYGRDFHCIYAGQIGKLRDQTLVLYLGEGLERFSLRSGGCGA